VRTGPGGDDFSSGACDSQRPFGSTDELAQFWLRFLGCKLIEEPRVATKKFFEAALLYVNDAITDPVEKTKVYDHVMSEMSSEKKTFAPRTFIEEYVPKAHRESFESFLKEQQVSLKQSHWTLRRLSVDSGGAHTTPPRELKFAFRRKKQTS